MKLLCLIGIIFLTHYLNIRIKQCQEKIKKFPKIDLLAYIPYNSQKVNPKIDLDHICALANLKLTAKDKKLLEPQMIEIIKWVNKLEKLEFDVSRGELYSFVSFFLPFRQDKRQPSFSIEEALGNSPERAGGFIKVPKVIEEK